MATQLCDSVIVVTGAFGVLGRATADRLLEAGARLVLIDRSAAPDALGDRDAVLALGAVDLGDEEAARQAFAQGAARFGGLDGLVNIAGGFRWEAFEGGRISTWDDMYALNLRTALAASHAVLPHLLARGGGRIVNVGALASGQAGTGMGAYAASKAGISRLTEAMDEEFRDRGIAVNAVMPSIIDTPTNRADMPAADPARWVRPESLAAVIAFLLSPDAEAIHGASIPVRGRV